MGKAKAPAEPETSLTDAVREARKELKDDNSRTLASEIYEYVGTKYPKYKEAKSMGSTLSQLRAKEDHNGNKIEAGEGKPKAGASKSEPTVSDLVKAKKLAAEMKMDTTELLATVHKLQTFGTLENLAACLEALQELTD